MKKTDLAYTAGLVDGEGTITLRKNRGSYQITVTLSLTEEYLIRNLQFRFGGRIYKHGVPKEHHRQVWRWTLLCREANDFIKLIYPYLILKKPQADLALKFQKILSAQPRGRHLTDEEKALRQAELLLMRSANKRGR